MTGNELRKQMEVLLQELGVEEQQSLKDSTILRAYRTFNYMQQMSEKNLVEAYHKIPMAEKSGYLKCLSFSDLAVRSQAIVDAYNLFTSLTLEDVLQFVLPRFAANIPEVMAALSAYTTSIAVGITLVLKIKMVIYRDDSQEMKGMSVFAIYEKQFPQKEGSRGYLGEKLFLRLYHAIKFSAPLPYDRLQLTPQDSAYEQAKRARACFDKLGLRISEKIEIGAAWFCQKKQPIDVAGTIFSNDQLAENYAEFNKGYTYMAASNPLTYLKTVAIDMNAYDLPLELGFVLPRFLQTFHMEPSENRVLIVDASAAFVHEYILHHNPNSIDTTFLFSDYHESALLKTYFKSGRYITKKLDYIRFIDMNFWINKLEETELLFNRVLMLNKNAFIDAVGLYTDSVAKYGSNDLKMYSLIPIHSLNVKGLMLTYEEQRLRISSVEILPQGIVRSSFPRRKLLVSTVMDQKPEQIQISRVHLHNKPNQLLLSHKQEDDLFLTPEEAIRCSSFAELYRKEALHRESNAKKAALSIEDQDTYAFRYNQRKRPYGHEFCPEFLIWYTISNDKKCLPGRHRITAYFCNLPNEEQAKRQDFLRGNKIDSTVKSITKISDSQIEEWIETIYTQKVRQTIIEEYGPYFMRVDVSFKLYWYLHPTVEDAIGEPVMPLFLEMMQTEMGFLPLNADAEILETTLIRVFPKASEQQLNQYWEFLYALVDHAICAGLLQQNQLASYAVLYAKKQRNLMGEVRNALMKRSFTTRELTLMTEVIQRELEHNCALLGVYMRLLTGLETNVICALCWSDFVCVKSHDFYQLQIARQVTNDGKELKKLRGIEDYRLIPCVPILAQALLKQRQYVLDTCFPNEKHSKINHLPIVTTMEQLSTKENLMQLTSPVALEKLSKKVINQVHIPDQIIYVPTLQNGTKETNLSRYHGDVFRSNYRFYLLERDEPIVDIDDMMYLLGNKATTTFAIKYYDYEEEESQYRIYKNLLKWNQYFTPLEEEVAHE